jgi:hypothetical protein
MTRRAERRLPRLPAGPLLAAIQRHPAVGWPRRGWTRRLRRYAGKGGVEAYRLAARDGLVSLTALEWLCDAFAGTRGSCTATPTTMRRSPAAGPTSTPGGGWRELG